ncbi:MAG: hypothetical protein WA459_25445 [Stellaceae bacterium]
MRSWQIIFASAVAAIIADALLFVPRALPWRPETAALLLAHWPAIAVVWLGAYGAAALVLTTLVVFLEIRGGAAPARSGRDWARRYVAGLAVAQYFTTNLSLFGLGALRVPIETAPFLFLPSPIGGSLALAVCGAVIVVGLLGGLFLAAALVTTQSPELRSDAPGIRAARLLPKVGEPPPAQAPAPPNAVADAAPLAELIAREQRPVLEAIRDMATAVNRLRRDLRHGLDEIKVALEDRRSGESTEAGFASPSAVEHAATELRAAVAAIDTSVAKLGEITSLMSANETLVVAGRDPPLPPASRSELSTELHALLRDMTPAAGKDDLPG